VRARLDAGRAQRLVTRRPGARVRQTSLVHRRLGLERQQLVLGAPWRRRGRSASAARRRAPPGEPSMKRVRAPMAVAAVQERVVEDEGPDRRGRTRPPAVVQRRVVVDAQSRRNADDRRWWAYTAYTQPTEGRP
jgi:hypothetical protein